MYLDVIRFGDGVLKRRVAGVDVEDIGKQNIVSEPLLKKLAKYDENSKLWKFAFLAFLIALVVNYLLSLFLDKRFEGGFVATKAGVFLISFILITFFAFAFLYIREKNYPKKNWVCPKCKEPFPYFTSRDECKGRAFLIDCDTLGIRLARIENGPFIVPRKCPNCNEKLWRE